MALLDINLNDTKTGIDLGVHINQQIQIPFIYITSYSDSATIASVKHSKPSSFLLKPYNKNLVLASIEIAWYNYSSNTDASEKSIDNKLDDTVANDLITNYHLIVKDGYRYIKIPLDDICWFESDKNYVSIKTADKKYLIRSSLKKLQESLPEAKFIKCNKQFIINIQKVESFNGHTIEIKGNQIAISRTEQAEVLKKLKV